MSTESIILVANEIINVNAADFVLLGLVALFFCSGLGYKIKSRREVSEIRGKVAKLVRSSEELGDKEDGLRNHMRDLLNAQNANVTEINSLKTKKIELSKVPITLSRELDNLIAWCHLKHISVNPERKMAAKRPTSN